MYDPTTMLYTMEIKCTYQTLLTVIVYCYHGYFHTSANFMLFTVWVEVMFAALNDWKFK